MAIKKLEHLSVLALGVSSSLSEPSSSAFFSSLRLCVLASTLRMFTSSLWSSAGSMLLTSSQLSTQRQAWTEQFA